MPWLHSGRNNKGGEMKNKPGLKYIRIEEKKSKYTKDVYYGVLRSQANGVITAMVVNPEKESPWMKVEEFSDKDYELTEADMDDVRHFFKAALTNAEKELDGAEFDLRDKKRNMATATERFSSYFQR